MNDKLETGLYFFRLLGSNNALVSRIMAGGTLPVEREALMMLHRMGVKTSTINHDNLLNGKTLLPF